MFQDGGYRAAARQTINIIRKHLPVDHDRAAIEAALEANYPFWVSGGLARKVWRKEARRFLCELGFRPCVRHELLRADGMTRRERKVIRNQRRLQ